MFLFLRSSCIIFVPKPVNNVIFVFISLPIIIIKYSVFFRGEQIDPNIDSIDTNVGIGIGSILA